eukprot:scaffold40430_cov65-Phaeocystis_antarctica.AAC.19
MLQNRGLSRKVGASGVSTVSPRRSAGRPSALPPIMGLASVPHSSISSCSIDHCSSCALVGGSTQSKERMPSVPYSTLDITVIPGWSWSGMAAPAGKTKTTMSNAGDSYTVCVLMTHGPSACLP